MPSPRPAAICICQEGHCDDACEVCATAEACPYDDTEPAEDLTETTEQRYKAAVAAARAAGVTMRVNLRGPSATAAGAVLIGKERYAFTYGSQCNAIAWRDGEAYGGYRFERLMRHALSRPWTVTAEKLAPLRAKNIYWYHGPEGTEAAQAVAEAFRAQGFDVDWDGTAGQAVTVKLPTGEVGR